MNPIGIQYLYWNGATLQDALDLTAASGANVFECGTTLVHAMTSLERRDFAKAVRALGLSLTLNGGMPGSDLCSPDPAVREESIRLSCEAIEAAAATGSPIWGGIIYSKWLDIPQAPLTQSRRQELLLRGIDALQRVLPVAERNGVDVCFEIVNRFEAYLITTAAEGIRFCEAINSPRAKLLLDVFHMNIEENSVTAALRDAMDHDRLGHLHISESNRGLPGLVKTDMDWNAIFKTLRTTGYTGVITMEPMVLMETPSSAKYRIWRDMVPDQSPETLLQAAQNSVRFVRDTMDAAAP